MLVSALKVIAYIRVATEFPAFRSLACGCGTGPGGDTRNVPSAEVMVEQTRHDSRQAAGNSVVSEDPQNPNKDEKSAPDMTSTGQGLTESILEPAANLLVTTASKPEAFYCKDDALAEVGGNGLTSP